jgi:hypothetical protein
MKFAEDRPWSDPEKAARKLLEIAKDVEVVQDGRIYIELINGPFLFREGATPGEYSAGLKLAIERGWLTLHESGTFVRFTRPVNRQAANQIDFTDVRECNRGGYSTGYFNGELP